MYTSYETRSEIAILRKKKADRLTKFVRDITCREWRKSHLTLGVLHIACSVQRLLPQRVDIKTARICWNVCRWVIIWQNLTHWFVRHCSAKLYVILVVVMMMMMMMMMMMIIRLCWTLCVPCPCIKCFYFYDKPANSRLQIYNSKWFYRTFFVRLFVYLCWLVIIHPDDGHTSDRNRLVKNHNMWLNIYRSWVCGS